MDHSTAQDIQKGKRGCRQWTVYMHATLHLWSMSAAAYEQAYSEVIEGDAGVVREQGAQLVQASQHHKRAAMVLGSQGHHMRAYRSHDASIGQHHMCANQYLHFAVSHEQTVLEMYAGGEWLDNCLGGHASLESANQPVSSQDRPSLLAWQVVLYTVNTWLLTS